MNVPKSEIQGGYSLICTAKSSGIILSHSGTPYLNEGNDCFRIFEDLDSLEQYVEIFKSEKKGPFEFLIYDSDGALVRTI
jgi:hypothetical protein